MIRNVRNVTDIEAVTTVTPRDADDVHQIGCDAFESLCDPLRPLPTIRGVYYEGYHGVTPWRHAYQPSHVRSDTEQTGRPTGTISVHISSTATL